MTNQQGAPEALFYADALDRCAEVDFDHIFVPAAAVIRRLHAENERLAALVEAQQPAPSAAAATEVENLRKALQFYADKDHFTIADDGAWDTVSGEPQNYWCDEEGTATVEDGTIARLALAGHQIKFDADEAPQPSPTPQADSAPLAAPADIVVLEAALRAIHQAIDLIGEPDTERLRTVRRVLRGAIVVAEDSTAPQADSQPAPVVGRMSPSKEWLETRLTIADDSGVQAGVPPKNARPCDAPPGCNSHNCLECNDYPRAARAPADSVTAPAGPSKSLPYEPTSAMLIAARERDPALPIETVRAIYWSMWRTAPTPPAQAADSVLEDAARWFSERDNVLHSFWVLLGEAEAQADNDNDPLLKHQVEGFYRQWNALNGSALVPRWVTRAARKQGGA